VAINKCWLLLILFSFVLWFALFSESLQTLQTILCWNDLCITGLFKCQSGCQINFRSLIDCLFCHSKCNWSLWNDFCSQLQSSLVSSVPAVVLFNHMIYQSNFVCLWNLRNEMSSHSIKTLLVNIRSTSLFIWKLCYRLSFNLQKLFSESSPKCCFTSQH